MRKLTALIIAAAFLVGCNDSVGNQRSNVTTSFGDSFDTGFRSSFRTKFVEKCVAGAKSTSGSNADFSVICDCSADKLLASKTVSQLMAGPGGDEIRGVAEQCAREHPLQ